MKTIFITILAFMMPLGVSLAQDAEIVLSQGEERVVELPDIAKEVDLSDANIISVAKSGTKARIIISALKTGVSRVEFKLADGSKLSYQVRVGERLSSVKAIVKDIPGVTISERGAQLIVKGKLRSRKDVQTLKRAKASYPGVIVDMTDQNVAETNTVVRTINRILKENDLGNMQAHAYGKFIVLEGSPKDIAQGELALRIAKVIYPGIEDRLDKQSNGGPAISIEVMFVEVTSHDSKEIGFQNRFNSENKDSTGSIAHAQVEPRTGNSRSGPWNINWQVGGLLSFLNLIQERSFSRVLSNPKLIARSGTEAKFHAGETKYLSDHKVQDGQVMTNYIPVDAGIMLNITPRIDAIGQIDSKIVTEVSEFNAQGKDSLPAVSKSNLSTAVTIADGETVMLSGLVRKKNQKVVSRVPLLADIPIVGELFKSRSNQDADTEMVILVTMKRVQQFQDQAKIYSQKVWSRGGDDIEFNLTD